MFVKNVAMVTEGLCGTIDHETKLSVRFKVTHSGGGLIFETVDARKRPFRQQRVHRACAIDRNR